MTSNTAPQGQLAGVRIVDLTTVVMGPMATRMLADMGADVIKIETVDGDLMRHYLPHRNPLMSGITLNLDRNKRSLALDLKTEEGVNTLMELTATADVLVTNMRAAALDRLGITHERIVEARPDIVYCAAIGFDSDGPWAGRPAYDDVIQAISGLAQMAEWYHDEPWFVPSIVADKTMALHIVSAITASLFRRATTGEGDKLEIPMAETMAAYNLVEHLSGHTFEPPIGEFSYQRVQTKGRRPRPTKDGWIALLPYSDQNWRDVFAFAGTPEIADDPRFATRPERVVYADDLYGLLNEASKSHTTAEWMDFCEAHNVPASPITDLAELRDSEYFNAVGLLEDAEHPTEGAYKIVSDPIRSNHKRQGLAHHAPTLGQHNEEILEELGKKNA